ncbi:DUF3575 domain-containing protein, partial [Bacteroides reticulotermitis]
MNKLLAKLLLLFLVSPLLLHAQQPYPANKNLLGGESLPVAALKTNLLTDLTGTFNLGAEFRLSNYLT